MEIGAAMNSGLQGMQRSNQQVSQASQEIASASASGRNDVQQQDNANVSGAQVATEAASETSQSVTATSTTDSLVSLNQGQTNFEANTRTVETADEVLGTMIDTNA
ncbi:MAG: flagellar basal body rod C-terminal domain-containing protein [Pseudomonadota bacterium]